MAGACGGIAAVQEHDRAFASSCRTAIKTCKVQESEYHKYLASEVASASAVMDDQVSDSKTVRATAKSV